jgi:hypothetical protein
VTSTSATGEKGLPARAIAPPYLVVRDFFETEVATALLKDVLARESAFRSTAVGRSGRASVLPHVRLSVATRDLGPFGPVIKARMLGLIPELVAKLGATPVASPTIELELVAHNDGAFYRRHIDTQTASDRHNIRMLSAVYYFRREPKGFSGGALRLFAIGDKDAGFVDVEPEHNTLLVFPSWVPHEVTAVSCPSKRFADSRFAINCWVRRGESKDA